jgi:hypothetical protein
MLAKSHYSQPSPKVRAIAQSFRFFGWVGFWVQLFFAAVSGLALLFAASGRSFSPDAHPGIGISIFWAICSVVSLCIVMVLDFRYTRIAKGLLHEPGAKLHPRKSETAQLLRVGALIGFIGIILALISGGFSIGVLVAKTVSQPPGVAIIDPNKIVRALDVFVVLASLNLIAAHLVGMVTSLWLLDRIHHHYHTS